MPARDRVHLPRTAGHGRAPAAVRLRPALRRAAQRHSVRPAGPVASAEYRQRGAGTAAWPFRRTPHEPIARGDLLGAYQGVGHRASQPGWLRHGFGGKGARCQQAYPAARACPRRDELSRRAGRGASTIDRLLSAEIILQPGTGRRSAGLQGTEQLSQGLSALVWRTARPLPGATVQGAPPRIRMERPGHVAGLLRHRSSGR